MNEEPTPVLPPQRGGSLPVLNSPAPQSPSLKFKLQQSIAKLKSLALQSKRNKIIALVFLCLTLLLLVGGVYAFYADSSNNSGPLPGLVGGSDLNGVGGASGVGDTTNQILDGQQQSGGSSNNSASNSGSSNTDGNNNGGSDSTPPPGITFSAPIGYLGGSLTVNARDGYTEQGGTKFWIRAGAYGGGTIDKWASGINPSNENNKYWDAFDNLHTRSQSIGSTKTFWLQLLGRAEQSDDEYYSDAAAVINEIKIRIPGVAIYVSAMNGYSETGVCDLPSEAPSQMRRVASRLAADGKALAGPYIGDITNAQLDSGATQCHANQAGRAVLGAPLLNFFK